MAPILLILLNALAALLAVDFLAGVFHWFEDAYAREDTPLLGPLVARTNIIHHHYPRYFTRLTWWQSSWDLLCLNIVILVAAWGFGVLSWEVWLFAAIATNANQIHKWSHRTRQENGRIISFLQDIRVLQTPRHHALHHTNPKECHYCTTTNLLNPILDRMRFWETLEWLLAKTLGLHRRPDTSVPGHGPVPAWLEEFRRPAIKST